MWLNELLHKPQAKPSAILCGRIASIEDVVPVALGNPGARICHGEASTQVSDDNPDKYLKQQTHFRIFFAAKRYNFGYSVVEYLNMYTDWVLHRIENEDSSVSVWNLTDLVCQLTYCYSHAAV